MRIAESKVAHAGFGTWVLLVALGGGPRAWAQAEPESQDPGAPVLPVLTLAEAVNLGRQNQPCLRRARADSDAATARSRQALAPLLPQLVGTASYQKTTGNYVPRPGYVPHPAPASSTKTPTASSSASQLPPNWNLFNFYNFGVTASQLLYDFGAAQGAYKGLKEDALAQKELEHASQLDVDLSVRTAFFQARALRELVKVARETLANQQRHLTQAQTFVEVGTRPEIDLAQVRTDVANARVLLIQAENAYLIGKARLNQAMGVDGPDDYDVSDETLSPLPEEDLSRDQVLQAALRLRPDLAALERRVRAQRLYTRAAKAGYGPSVTASSTLNDQGLDLNQLKWNWNAGVLLTWSLFQGGATRAATQVAEANARGALADQDATRQAVKLEVEEARLGVRAARAVMDAADEALTNARERLKLAEGRYAAGVGNVIELGDAQLALTGAESQRVQAGYNLAVARASLLKALGKTE